MIIYLLNEIIFIFISLSIQILAVWNITLLN